MDKKEPENPVFYLSNLVKKLDVKNRNGLVALAILNLLVILLFKFYLKGTGLLSWICLKIVLFCIFKFLSQSICLLFIKKPPYAPPCNGNIIKG